MMSYAEENLKPSVTLLSTSELEEEIKNLSEELKKIKNSNDDEHKKIYDSISNLARSLAWLNISKSQGVWKSKTCKHSVNFVCQAWNISDEEKLGIPSDFISVNQDGSKKVIVSKFPEICISCPLYEARRS
ncbi:MAG: hypothetical protein QXH75_02260 [Sulfolobaceae archaeon]